jgi:dephospho-CoA kinase
MIVIGVTGYSGCGKSYISQLISTLAQNIFQKTWAVLGADQLAFQLRNYNAEIKEKVVNILGSDVYDKETGLSIPKRINEIIFDPKNAQKRVQYVVLNAILTE